VVNGIWRAKKKQHQWRGINEKKEISKAYNRKRKYQHGGMAADNSNSVAASAP